ncbi:MAG: MFS transporter [Patescibacteria group bacterium]
MDQLTTRPYSFRTLIGKVPRPIKIMAVVMFFFEFGFGFIDPWWVIYIEKITSNFFITGVVIALFSLSGLILTLPLGQVIDRFDHKTIIRASLVMYLAVASLYFAAGYLNSIPLLVVAVLINGASSIIMYETSQAYVDNHYEGDKSFNYSFYISLDALGYMVGTLAVLAIVAWWPLYYGFLVVALFILLTLLVERRLPATSSKPAPISLIARNLVSSEFFTKAVKALPHYSSFFYLQIIAVFSLLFIQFGFMIFLPLFGIEQKLSLLQIGLVSIFFQIPIFLSVYYATWLGRLAKKYVILIFFSLIGILMFIFFVIHSQVVFFLVSFFISSSLAILNLTVRPVIFSLSPNHLEGEAASITKFSEKLATVTAPLVVGWLATAYGISFSYILFAALAFLLAIIGFYFYSRYHSQVAGVTLKFKHVHRSGN